MEGNETIFSISIEDSSHLVNRMNFCSLWSWLKHFFLQGNFL